MAGINNFNLNNLKLQQTQQLKATLNVDAQNNKNKEVGVARPSGLWTGVVDGDTVKFAGEKNNPPVAGDKVIANGQLFVIVGNPSFNGYNWTCKTEPCDRITSEDVADGRGNVEGSMR